MNNYDHYIKTVNVLEKLVYLPAHSAQSGFHILGKNDNPVLGVHAVPICDELSPEVAQRLVGAAPGMFQTLRATLNLMEEIKQGMLDAGEHKHSKRMKDINEIIRSYNRSIDAIVYGVEVAEENYQESVANERG